MLVPNFADMGWIWCKKHTYSLQNEKLMPKNPVSARDLNPEIKLFKKSSQNQPNRSSGGWPNIPSATPQRAVFPEKK